MSEIRLLEWSWEDFESRRIVWPDSKTGDMSKPMSEVAYQLLNNAYRFEGSPYVCPSIHDSQLPLPSSTYYNDWRRILSRAKVPRVGTHGIRHRAATDIANSGVSIKVGMALTAHKTVSMFMTYVHTENDPVRAAAEKVASMRQSTIDKHVCPALPVPVDTDRGQTRASKASYRPFRHRKINDREAPPGTKRTHAASTR